MFKIDDPQWIEGVYQIRPDAAAVICVDISFSAYWVGEDRRRAKFFARSAFAVGAIGNAKARDLALCIDDNLWRQSQAWQTESSYPLSARRVDRRNVWVVSATFDLDRVPSESAPWDKDKARSWGLGIAQACRQSALSHGCASSRIEQVKVFSKERIESVCVPLIAEIESHWLSEVSEVGGSSRSRRSGSL